jgi:hypothetical protein
MFSLRPSILLQDQKKQQQQKKKSNRSQFSNRRKMSPKYIPSTKEYSFFTR